MSDPNYIQELKASVDIESSGEAFRDEYRNIKKEPAVNNPLNHFLTFIKKKS